MKIQTLNQLEHAIGGRPKMKLRRKKVRLSFYLSPNEAKQLKVYADNHDKTVSELVRSLLKSKLAKQN